MECDAIKSPTICDVKAERDCRAALKMFTRQAVLFVDEMKAFLDTEKPVVQEMWKLSFKVNLLSSSKKPQLYPEEIATWALGELLSELNDLINKHATRLQDCQTELYELQKYHKSLTSTSFALDWDSNLDIFKGNEYQKPLKYFINVGDEVVKDAKLILLSVKTHFEILCVNDSSTFESYTKSFVITDDFLKLLNEFIVFCNIYLKYS